MSWQRLQEQQPELAAFGAERLNGKVAYLATTRKDGSPRVHPMTPIIGQGRLFVFMEPTSPKGHDLRRDGRYALGHDVALAPGGGKIDVGDSLVLGRAAVQAVEGAHALEGVFWLLTKLARLATWAVLVAASQATHSPSWSSASICEGSPGPMKLGLTTAAIVFDLLCRECYNCRAPAALA